MLTSLRRADAGYERRLRQATMGRSIMQNPEIRAQVDKLLALPEGSEARMAAAGKLRESPAADRLAKEINRTLGDFTSMGDFEKGFVRRVIPFYAWYKAIFKITLGLPVNNPLRATILWKLGQLGQEHMADYGNPRIYGAVPFAGGILRTGGYNPYATIPDTLRSLGVLARGELGAIPHTGISQPSAAQLGFSAGPLNPFVASLLTGGLWHTFRYLPQARLVAPPPSKTYSDAGRLAELYSYLGVPYRHPTSYNTPETTP